MSNEKRLNDFIAIEAKGLSSDSLITSSRAWLTAADVMSRNVATIAPDETVVSAAIMMSEEGISCLAVVDNGHVAGILTETDMLRRVARNGRHFYRVKLDQIMSHPVQSISPETSVLQASEIMGRMRVKRLPILERERLIGIVTQTDLVRVLTSYGMWRDISEIMSRNVTAIGANASVAEAAEVMTSRKISCIVVLEDDEAAGVLTEKDMLRRVVALKRDPACVKMRDVMSSPISSIPASCSVFSAGKMMEEMSVRRLVVTEDNQVCGVVTQSDIFMMVRSKLQAEEEKNLSLLDESKSNIYTTDLDGRITYVNRAFMDLLELSDPAELISQHFLPERFCPDSKAVKQFLDELKKGSIESRELALRTSRGQRVYVTVFPSVTRDIHRQINGSQGVVYDITAKKELVALREAEEKLAKLNKHLESVVLELTRTNKELQEFAHVAAHDLKTPLRAIGMLADWISTDYSDKFDEQGKEQVRLLVGKARHMSSLIDDILQYSSLGKDVRERQRVELNAVLPEVIADVAPPKNIDITVETDLPTIVCDETHIIQIFQNFLSNAIKYIDKPKGHIKVGCAEEDDFWKFSVSDNGPGIDGKYSEKIFQIFQTLAPRDGVESTGIGLSIVKKISELNGGRAWVESEVGEGSTFFFTLPK
jgi:PAS domain S-box-containing protein